MAQLFSNKFTRTVALLSDFFVAECQAVFFSKHTST